MTTPIDRLAEIAKRTEAATPGPWTVCDDYSDVHGLGDIHLASYWNPTAGDRNGEFIAHARADIPWLLNQLRLAFGEIAELQAKLATVERQNAELDSSLDQVIRERDNYHDIADKLAYAVAPIEVIGEHSNLNCPWQNALDLITPMAEVDQLRRDVAAYEKALVPDGGKA